MPDEGTPLWQLSATLLTRMMTVYAASACTLVLRSEEPQQFRYHKRAWTLQEFCGARRVLLADESHPRDENSKSFLGDSGTAALTKAESEVFPTKRLRILDGMRTAMPMWVLSLFGPTPGADVLEGVRAYNEAKGQVQCQVPSDMPRALLPMMLNTPVQDGQELIRLASIARSACEEGTPEANALEEALRLLLGDEVASSDPLPTAPEPSDEENPEKKTAWL